MDLSVSAGIDNELRTDGWRRLSIPLLQCFIAVYSERSVTRAAAVLRLPQSTVSTAVAKLRKIYQDPLFVAGGRRLEPTTKAHEIATPIAQALAELERSIVSNTNFRPQEVSAQFHIAMVDLVQYRLLPGLISLLAREAPHIRLSVTSLAISSVEESLASRQLDLAVASSALTLKSVRYRQLYEERFTCIVGKDHPLLHQKWTIKQFVTLPHIQVSPVGSTFVSMIDRVLAEQGCARLVHHFVPTYQIAARVVANSDYVVLMPAWVAEDIAKTYPIAIKAPPVPLKPLPIIQMWHERSQSDPLHAWLRQRVVDVAEACER